MARHKIAGRRLPSFGRRRRRHGLRNGLRSKGRVVGVLAATCGALVAGATAVIWARSRPPLTSVST